MHLPVNPPVAPMLARPVPQIPEGPFSFEPKWDGFRSIVFLDRGEVEIGSRNERPMTRYFPEVAAALSANLPPRCVVDGEIVIPDASGRRLDFEALLQRIHPAASRVALLAEQTPAHFVAFDLLALDDTDLCGEPFADRRAALEQALAQARSPVHLTPATTDRDLAGQWFEQFEGAGLDGLIAKPLDGPYQPDKRVMFKIKHERTADCVVAGYRPHKSGPEAVGSLLLGLYTDAGDLASVGVVGAFPMAPPPRAVHRDAAPGHHVRWSSVALGRRGGGRRHAGGAQPPGRGGEPVERGEGPVLRPAAPGAGGGGPLRPHGGPPVPAYRPVRPLAPGPGPALVHLRPAGGAGEVRPGRDPGRLAG